MEKVLSVLDKENKGELCFALSEVRSWIDGDVIQFDENDILSWVTTSNVITLKVYIHDIEFEVSSLLLDLFEYQFNTNFHKNLYTLELCNTL